MQRPDHGTATSKGRISVRISSPTTFIDGPTISVHVKKLDMRVITGGLLRRPSRFAYVYLRLVGHCSK